ncbi:hypothetical protein PHIM7_119 [Sinorhizobium phage phiM7]|uniref:Transmembrane protein n=2 Tax=Emdodecavirus TaxID=1980937 RepID=A0A0R8UEL0_9CAUD|nr:hypothetical protein AVT40_gp400 [Sinorhizobium phage phiN3]YP_009601244.1 hypothetical protein FDH46_gp359 [Sinorhizobium phage phiM7]AKF12665.1 hypothetical protein PHIM7_119 [Sinorhizobium phage phiM7]AKN19828.1 hypothetical protein PHIM19_120 [Sinorhizobium phage phiM19]AKZ65598.1 hypothetical protein PHIN3_133 [Sinorhizobium phage phiN3]
MITACICGMFVHPIGATAMFLLFVPMAVLIFLVVHSEIYY